jgi:hypothetical protein
MQWYAAPLHIQKTVLFLLQGSMKSYHIVIGGLFVASMETAATVKMSFHKTTREMKQLYQIKIIYIIDI